MYILMIKIYF